jgi:general secretion pathway protein D
VQLNENPANGLTRYQSNNPEALPPKDVGNPFVREVDTNETDSGGVSGILSDIMFGDKTFVQATITALDKVTDLRAVAAPSLVVRNNASATITVGTQIPVQSSSINTGNGNPVTSAQYVSTGVTLSVTPRINPGGLVYMDIAQEVSRPGTPATAGGNPPIDNKNVDSQVAVQSGQTIFLGGLIQEQDSRGTSGVPYLNRIPGVGALFGRKSIDKLRNETIVMITPTVLVNTTDLRAVTEDMRDEFIKVPPMTITTLRKNNANTQN